MNTAGVYKQKYLIGQNRAVCLICIPPKRPWLWWSPFSPRLNLYSNLARPPSGCDCNDHTTNKHWERKCLVTCTPPRNKALSRFVEAHFRNKLRIALFPAVLSLWTGNRNMCRIFIRKLKRMASVIQIPLQNFLRVKWTDGKRCK